MVISIVIQVGGYTMINCLVPVGLTANDTLYTAICGFLEVSLFY